METILIVDDNPTIRNLVRSFIKISHPGAVIVHDAEHGTRAWELINAPGKKIDVLISDVDMETDMNGVQLTEMVRQKHPDIRIILMSGDSEPQGHKAHAFLPKPFARADLLKIMNALRK